MQTIPTFKKRTTHTVQIGSVKIGADHPVVVQSMTNTNTADAQATAQQCFDLWNAGSEIVRITVNNEEAAQAVPQIVALLQEMGWKEPLLVGDFHYNGHTLLQKYPAMAQALAKYRINPGNVGFGDKHDANFAAIVQCAVLYNKPVRIGVNWGSLDAELLQNYMDANMRLPQPASNDEVMIQALIQSALQSAQAAQALGLGADKIVLSCKVSDVLILHRVYKELSVHPYPLHLGLTEAGMDSKGIIATTAAFAPLLLAGIGETIRASLTPAPGGDRAQEVRVCQEILQSLHIRSFMPAVTACPGCGRTTSTVFQSLAQQVQAAIRQNMPRWKKNYPGVENLKIAVMGCVVNGPGESKHANIGISLPGTGEQPKAPVFIDGVKVKTLQGPTLTQDFINLVEKYVQTRYSVHMQHFD